MEKVSQLLLVVVLFFILFSTFEQWKCGSMETINYVKENYCSVCDSWQMYMIMVIVKWTQ